jgi:hypothetical protein
MFPQLDTLLIQRIHQGIIDSVAAGLGKHSFFVPSQPLPIALIERPDPKTILDEQWAEGWTRTVFELLKELSLTWLLEDSKLNGSAWGFDPEYQGEIPGEIVLGEDPEGFPDWVTLTIPKGETVGVTYLERSHELPSAPYCAQVVNKISCWHLRRRQWTAGTEEDREVAINVSEALFNSMVIAGNGTLNKGADLLLYENLDATLGEIYSQLRLTPCRVLTGFEVVQPYSIEILADWNDPRMFPVRSYPAPVGPPVEYINPVFSPVPDWFHFASLQIGQAEDVTTDPEVFGHPISWRNIGEGGELLLQGEVFYLGEATASSDGGKFTLDWGAVSTFLSDTWQGQMAVAVEGLPRGELGFGIFGGGALPGTGLIKIPKDPRDTDLEVLAPIVSGSVELDGLPLVFTVAQNRVSALPTIVTYTITAEYRVEETEYQDVSEERTLIIDPDRTEQTLSIGSGEQFITSVNPGLITGERLFTLTLTKATNEEDAEPEATETEITYSSETATGAVFPPATPRVTRLLTSQYYAYNEFGFYRLWYDWLFCNIHHFYPPQLIQKTTNWFNVNLTRVNRRPYSAQMGRVTVKGTFFNSYGGTAKAPEFEQEQHYVGDFEEPGLHLGEYSFVVEATIWDEQPTVVEPLTKEELEALIYPNGRDKEPYGLDPDTDNGDIMPDSKRLMEIHTALEAERFATHPDSTEESPKATARTLAKLMEASSYVLGVNFDEDGKNIAYEPPGYIEQDYLPTLNNNKSLRNAQFAIRQDEAGRVVTDSLYSVRRATVTQGRKGSQVKPSGAMRVNSLPQFLDVIMDELEGFFGGNDIQVPSANGVDYAVYDNFNEALADALYMLSVQSKNVNELQNQAIKSIWLTQELLKGLGLPSHVHKIPGVNYPPSDPSKEYFQGQIAVAELDQDGPTLTGLLGLILLNLSRVVAGTIDWRDDATAPTATPLNSPPPSSDDGDDNGSGVVVT